jgi:hypothetical protein
MGVRGEWKRTEASVSNFWLKEGAGEPGAEQNDGESGGDHRDD